MGDVTVMRSVTVMGDVTVMGSVRLGQPMTKSP